METLNEKVQFIRATLENITPLTASILNELLLVNGSQQTSKKSTCVDARRVNTRSYPVNSRAMKLVSHPVSVKNDENLSLKVKSALATEVINITLRSLSEALKSPNPPNTLRPTSKTPITSSEGDNGRRSSLTSDTTLSSRRSSRNTNSTNTLIREPKTSISTFSSDSELRLIAECARIAFSYLRAIQFSHVTDFKLIYLQLENGMSVLISKLISLGMEDLAIKELRILKRCLIADEKSKRRPIFNSNQEITKGNSLADLLDFGVVESTGLKLELVVSTQLQILRLMTSSKKPKNGEIALQILHPTNPSSLVRLFLILGESTKEVKKKEKIIRQFQSLTDIIFSLCPSILALHDTLAVEPKISLSPEVAIQLQTIALQSRLSCWDLSKRKGDLSKDILKPFLYCLSAYCRRSKNTPSETLSIGVNATETLEKLLENHSDTSASLNSILVQIYMLLASLAKDACQIDAAIRWIDQSYGILKKENASDVKLYAVIARLIALRLQSSTRKPLEEEQLSNLLKYLEHPFKGEASEIDELLIEISNARRAALNIFIQLKKSPGTAVYISENLQEMCRSLVFLYPRLCLRYLGNTPDSSSSSKEFKQFNKRLIFITKFSFHAIDSSLFLVKTLLGQKLLNWDILDSRLQDCIYLLNKIDLKTGESSCNTAKTTSTLCYRARISNLYYTQYLDSRIDQDQAKNSHMIKILRRSIECIRGRPLQERKIALFTTKLERLAEMYKNLGRRDELLQVLCALRDELIEEDTLSDVLQRAAYQPLQATWNDSREIAMLGRTIHSILKLQLKSKIPVAQISIYEDSWSKEHRAIILEYELELLCSQTMSRSKLILELQNIVYQQLMSLYSGSKYPLRRLRTVLKILQFSFGNLNEGLKEAEAELEPNVIEHLAIEDTEDNGLSNYCTHYKAMAMILKELNSNEPCLIKLRKGLAIWSCIASKCQNLTDLNNYIDDILGLLSIMKTVIDWLQVHGHDSTRVTALRLVVELSEKAEGIVNTDELILNHINLGVQWLNLGYTGKAGLAHDRAQTLYQKAGGSNFVALRLHIFSSEYQLTVGNLNEAEANLSIFQIAFSKQKESLTHSKIDFTSDQKTKMSIIISNAYSINSKFALERGLVYPALTYAKQSVDLLRRTWVSIEDYVNRQKRALGNASPSETEILAGELSKISLSNSSQSSSIENENCKDSQSFWVIIMPLFHSLNHLSAVFSHCGMFQETVYYAEQAYKLVKQVNSNINLAISGITLGNIWLRGGYINKGSHLLEEAQNLLSSTEKSKHAALLAYNLGMMNSLLGNYDTEISFYNDAISIFNNIIRKEYISSIEVISKPVELFENQKSLCKTKQKVLASERIKSQKKPTNRNNIATTSKSRNDSMSSAAIDCPCLLSLRSNVIREKSRVYMLQKQWADASSLLLEAETSFSLADKVSHGLALSKNLLIQSLHQMDVDPVYSMLQDSTISFPSILGVSKLLRNGEMNAVSNPSPPKKVINTRNGRERTNSRSSSDNFLDKLRRSQDYLRDTLTTALIVSPIAIIYKTSCLLDSVAVLLSTVDQIKGKSITSPRLSSLFVETARNIAHRRGRGAIQINPKLKIKSDGLDLPQLIPLDNRRSSFGSHDDNLLKFEREYIDIIPKPWTVVSISLSENRHELSLTRLQAGNSPFIVRLPLGRSSSIDTHEEIFDFEQGHTELQEVIRLANESAHDASNRLGRDARLSWWKEREALDARMKDLLQNIEKVWLGGFTGIFTQHIRRPELFTRFQKSLQGILDKYLPSRQKGSKRRRVSRVTLDSRIFELFIGLGDICGEGRDLSEPLIDLLYFVIDVLQFHGELNAYAEIDFDMIVLETTDALQCYHEAVRSIGQVDEGRHTILIIDKSLLAFPWESLPCLDGLAVSRLPCLESLRERIILRSESIDANMLDGYYIDRSLGSYILNPGGDLKHTLGIFQKKLQNLQGWEGVVNREPSEEEFKDCLQKKDLFLYFGHGSGSQYIRAREIQKLSKCAVTFLMGCSSGALVETGEFEPYGPPINYLRAGSHALVATLWDVTDKDIDRFAKSTFEKWGLFRPQSHPEARPKDSGKNRVNDQQVEDIGSISLAEAVAIGRQACHLRYLNAAAVCVYGVPVYFKN